MAETMRALLLKGDGYATTRPDDITLSNVADLLELGELPVPQPAEGQVLVKVSLAAVNPSDEMFIQGLYGQPRIAGNAAGFEGVGEVVASGGGAPADGYVGQRVAFVATPGSPGTWSEYSIADANTCIPLIDAVRDEDGAAMIVNPLTALAMFDIVKGDDAKAFILSAGASQLCKLLMRVAADEGYRPIALVRRDDQIPLLEDLGATHVLNITADDFAARLADVLKEERPKVFLDAVANQVSARVFDAMGRQARWVVYGKLDPEPPTIAQPGHLIFMGKRIEGFWLSRWLVDTPMADKVTAISAAQMRFASGEWKTDVNAILGFDDAIARLPAELAEPNGKVFLRP